MLETPHVAVGAAIATKIANPFVSLPLAFLSHLLLEKVPHWNPHLNTEKKTFGKVTKKSTTIVIIDSVSALSLGLWIALSKSSNFEQFVIILLACFFSVLPDLVEAPYFFLNLKSNLIERWIKFQKSLQVDTSVVPGLTTQILTIALALWWIFK
ncbi:MAG: hypothetical protein KatS3mg088_635 [Patescibacteria group bacterium]|nr:MAG: hypothetical protein KatS3mg088_635 [Patescibacteria group bacterium]